MRVPIAGAALVELSAGPVSAWAPAIAAADLSMSF